MKLLACCVERLRWHAGTVRLYYLVGKSIARQWARDRVSELLQWIVLMLTRLQRWI